MPAMAAPRFSADYSIAMESLDQGGTGLVSTDYAVAASANDFGATVIGEFAGYVARSGFIGQLFDKVAVTPTSASPTLNEGPAQPGSTIQLGVAEVLDDNTLLPFSPFLAEWSVVSGPLSGIDANGLASAAVVYQDTAATVSASYQGLSGILPLTVRNVSDDDFGSYAGDSLPDNWQVQYFGLNNPNAAPSADVTGTGQTNSFKYLAGLDPTDSASVFRVTLQPAPGQPNKLQIVFSPVVAGRTYTVYSSTNLAGWTPLTGALQSDTGSQRTLTDPGAIGKSKFYRVGISKP